MANVIKHKRGSGSDPSASDLVVGELAIRTDTGKLFTKMDSGALAEIAGGGSDIAINTLSASSGSGGNVSGVFDSSAYRFTLSSPPSVSAQQLLVSINGVIQKPVAGTGQPSEGFSVDGNDIIFGDAPATGADFFILTFRSLGVSVPADNSVTSAKIADGAIVNADINANAAIDGNKIAPTFTSAVSISSTTPILNFTETDANPDYRIVTGGGEFVIQNDQSGSFATRLQINADGHVDVTGNLDVGAGLDVTGAITGTGDLTIDTNTLHVDSSNNRVGIGTTTPSDNLEIASGVPTLRLTDTDGGPSYHQIKGPGNGDLRISCDVGDTSSSASEIQFDIHDSNKMVIQSTGKVGIGETSPEANLHVKEGDSGATPNSNRDTLFIENNGNSGLTIGTPPTHSGYLAFADPQNDNAGQIIYRHNNDDMGFFTAGTERLLVESDGKVKVKTANLLDAFQIDFGAGFVLKLDGAGNISQFRGDGSTGGLVIDTAITSGSFGSGGGFISFKPKGSDALFIAGDGDIGIGTTTPGSLLTLNHATNPAIQFQDSGTKVASINAEGSSTNIASFEGKSLVFATSTGSSFNTAMTIDTSQRVMIGVNDTSHASANADDLCVGNNDSSSEHGITIGSNSAGSIRFSDSAHGSIGIINYDHGLDQLAFYTGATVRITLQSSGAAFSVPIQLGSGNSHNSAKIVLQGSTNNDTTNAIFIKNSDETELFSLRNDGVFYTGVDGASPYNLTTSSAANMHVSSTGAVRRSTSSVRYKKDIADATFGLADVLKLKPKTFKSNATGEFADDKTHAGFTAEDIHDLGLTEFVEYNEDNEPDALDYGNMVALMAKAIQDLNAKVEALEAG